MNPTVLNAIVLAVATGAVGWCVWHCIRGMRRMRNGQSQAAGCCQSGAASSGDAASQLDALRRELADLKSGRESVKR